LSGYSSINCRCIPYLVTIINMRWTTIFLLASTATAFSWPEASSVTDLFARKNGGLKNSGSSGNGSSSSGSSGSGSGSSGNGKCPIVWAQISKDLTKAFLQDGQCNPLARAAIREIFHDCGGMQIVLEMASRVDSPLTCASLGEKTRREAWL
jgi:L-ascorbate peroxidase